MEACVKLVKRLIYGSIRNSVLDYFDFDFIVQQTIHLVNRRPIAFKESLRDMNVTECLPCAITPEILLRGYELVSLNLVPELRVDDFRDPTWKSTNVDPIKHVRDSNSRLSLCRAFLVDLYNREFASNLMFQGTNSRDRYRTVKCNSLRIGDLILLKEPLLKPVNFPMAIVRQVTLNDIGEVTSVLALKGSTKELVKRHATSVIPFISVEYSSLDKFDNAVHELISTEPSAGKTLNIRPTRRAALHSRNLTKTLASQDMI